MSIKFCWKLSDQHLNKVSFLVWWIEGMVRSKDDVSKPNLQAYWSVQSVWGLYHWSFSASLMRLQSICSKNGILLSSNIVWWIWRFEIRYLVRFSTDVIFESYIKFHRKWPILVGLEVWRSTEPFLPANADFLVLRPLQHSVSKFFRMPFTTQLLYRTPYFTLQSAIVI